MDRVNRSFLVATTLIAIPAVLAMASFSLGTSPDVQLAVGQPVDDSGAVQQVVGKQPSSRQTRPGLLQVITGSRGEGSRDQQRQNMPRQESRGLFDGLFDASVGPIVPRQEARTHNHHNHSQHNHNHNHSQHNHNHNTQASRTTHRSTGSPTRSSTADWDGVPYHRVNPSATRTASSEPIRDPGNELAATGGRTRIIRGGSSRPTPVTTASVRRFHEPTLAPEPAPALAVPSSPKSISAMPASTRTFSNQSSSRRTDRRKVGALDVGEVSKPAEAATEESAVDSEEIDLVPRVVRKKLDDESTKTAQAKAEPTEPEEAEAVEQQTAETSSSVAAKTEPAALPAEPTAEALPENPEANTALAAIGTPMPAPLEEEPASATDAIPASAGPAAEAQPAYTTPVDSENSPVPVAGIPTHPYAASSPSGSIPATSASHRAGPPGSAFQPMPQGQAQFNAASSPIGSGVVPNGDVASYRRESSHPSVDPYAPQPVTYPAPQGALQANATTPSPELVAGGAPALGRMTTYGQPVAGPTAATNSPAPLAPSVPQTGTAIPMQPIGAGNAPLPPASDNFARSDAQSRNQMRDTMTGLKPGSTAATSELPGIRVVTHGPSAIMLRQTSQYEILVENRGAIDATGVLVRAAVPDWAEIRARNATRGDIDNQVQGSTERLVWTIDHLPAGASEKMFVRLTAARSGTYQLDVDWTLLPQKSVAKVQVREPRLDLTIDGPDEVVFGKSQTYKVRVLNPGDGTAPNVVFTLSPNSATPQTQRIGDIPPGKEAQFDVELTAQDLGDLKIHGLASGDLDLRAESSKTIRVAAAQLEAILSGPELKYQNTDATYSLQVQNTGSATSEKIVASLRLPSGVKYLGGMDEAVFQGNTLKWEITALAPGASRDYQFRCGMTSTGEHLFAFDCSGTAAGSASVSLATQVESIADLVLTVSDPAAPAPIGSEVTYEIVIRNRGSKEATDVRAVAQFSHGIEPQRIEGQSGEVVTGQVLFDTIPRIAAGQEIRMRVIAKADRPGHHRFRTEVRSGDTILVAEEATHYMSPKSDRVSRRSTDGTNR